MARLNNRPYVPFIVLSSGRSGSNLLVSLLRSHPDVRCFGELLNVRTGRIDYFVEGYDNRSPEDLAAREEDLARFLQQRIYCEHPSSVRAVGFKPMYQHLPFFPEVLDWLVAQPDLRVIHSKRQNLLRLFVSFSIASRSGQWIAPVTGRSRPRTQLWRQALRRGLMPARVIKRALLPKDAPRMKNKAVTLTRDDCMFMFNWVRREEAYYAERFGNHAVWDIYYENLVRDIPGTSTEMQRFLGLESRNLTVGTTRQNPEPLRELIANYDELRESFRGTDYEAVFEESR